MTGNGDEQEEAHPEEFFVPYVWSLVCAHSGIPWDPQAIALFAPMSGFDHSGQQQGEGVEHDADPITP
jgi:hypothetical protein